MEIIKTTNITKTLKAPSSQKIRVLINAIHSKTGGGLVYLNNILPFLAEDNELDITIVCHKNYRNRLQIPPKIKVHEVNFKGGFFITLLWEQFVLPLIARRLKSQTTLNIANFAPLFAPKPVILLTNNPEVRFFTSSFTQKIYWWALILMTRISLLVSPIALSNGKYLQNIYAGGILKHLQKKIYNAPSACTFTPKKGLKRIKGQILAVGDFYIHKDYPSLLKAFALVQKSLPETNLVIVGREVDVQETSRIKNLVSELKINKAVTFTGSVPHEKIVELYATSEIYVSPSKAESFSLTLLEAMTMELPAVVIDYPFQHEVAGNDAALYVKVYNDKYNTYDNKKLYPKEDIDTENKTAEALGKNILELLQNKQLADRIRQRGKQLAAGYNWQKTARTVAQVLKKAVVETSAKVKD